MQITMQKIRIEITKTNKTPAKNWNIPFDVVVMQTATKEDNTVD